MRFLSIVITIFDFPISLFYYKQMRAVFAFRAEKKIFLDGSEFVDIENMVDVDDVLFTARRRSPEGAITGR